MEESVFHPNSASLPRVMIDAILKRWSFPSIDFLPGHEDYGDGFVVHDSFVGEWKVTIEKVK